MRVCPLRTSNGRGLSTGLWWSWNMSELAVRQIGLGVDEHLADLDDSLEVFRHSRRYGRPEPERPAVSGPWWPGRLPNLGAKNLADFEYWPIPIYRPASRSLLQHGENLARNRAWSGEGVSIEFSRLGQGRAVDADHSGQVGPGESLSFRRRVFSRASSTVPMSVREGPANESAR